MFFFFQAEDGIRYYKVTGVQTCALPIWLLDRALDALLLELQQHPRQPRAADLVARVERISLAQPFVDRERAIDEALLELELGHLFGVELAGHVEERVAHGRSVACERWAIRRDVSDLPDDLAIRERGFTGRGWAGGPRGVR